MEGQPQKDLPGQRASFFERKKWWRPLYYLYFAGIIVGFFFLYSAHERSKQAPVSESRVAVKTPPAKQPTTTPAASKGIVPASSAGSKQPASLGKFADMMSPSEEMIEKGKNLYMDNCVACHGANGEGDGPAAAALKPKPRDFHSAKGWINGRMVSDMFKTLTNGIPGSPMPPFSTISVTDRLDIISYIRSFKGFPKETKSDIEALAKLAAKAGSAEQGSD